MTTASVTITRPANTTAYGAGDVIGFADADTAADAGNAVLAFGRLTDVEESDVIITSAMFKIYDTAIPASATTYVLHLYSDEPVDILDAATWVMTDAIDKAAYLGSITFTPADIGDMLWSRVDGLNIHVPLAAGNVGVWGELVTTGAHTPDSGGVYFISLSAIPA